MNALRAVLSRPASWFAIALVGALTGVALQLAIGSDGSPGVSVVAAVPSSADTSNEVGNAEAAPSPDGRTPATPEQSGVPTAEASATTSDLDRPAADGSSPAAVSITPPANATGLRVRIPALGIDARVVSLGFASDGQLAVPRDGSSVGWYEISPRPGQAGNALLGAHFDWDGSLAVFAGLSRLTPGDRVFVDDGSASELAYEVSEATAVAWDSPVSDILSAAGSGSSLTLFTCGGEFDESRGEYDQRVVVRAVEVGASAPLMARR